MWNGEVLGECESRLVGDAAWGLFDEISVWNLEQGGQGQEDDRAVVGIPLFDELTGAQQIVLLDRVVLYLTDPTLESPPRSALLDATVAAIYVKIYESIEIEIDMQNMTEDFEEGDTDARKEVVAAYREREDGPEGLSFCPDAECTVMDTWELVVNSLRDRVLPDEDWMFTEMALDLAPEQAEGIKQVMGISKDYFTDVPPEVTADEARVAWANLIERVGGKRPPI